MGVCDGDFERRSIDAAVSVASASRTLSVTRRRLMTAAPGVLRFHPASNSDCCGHDEALGSTTLAVPPGGCFDQGQRSAVFGVGNVGQRPHCLFVENAKSRRAHATAAARPSA